MAAKRKRAKKKNPTKKRRHKRNPSPKKRAHARKRRANPKRRHARRNPPRRVRRANPKRRHARRNPLRVHHRAKRRNPSKRRHRRNPGIPTWAMAGLAAGAGLVTYAIGQAGSFAIAQRVGKNREHLDTIRYGAFGVFTLAGLAIAAFGSPMIGAGVAAGGLMGLGGTELSLALGRVVDKTEGPPAKLAAVYGNDRQQFGAVYGGGGQQQFGAVFQQMTGGQNMGATFTGGQQTFGQVEEYYAG